MVLSCAAACIFALSLPSCDSAKRELRKNVSKMQGAVVTMPTEMLAIQDGAMTFAAPDSASHQLVFYFDSSECTSCRVSHLRDLEGLFTLEESHPGFKVKVIFSPREEELESLIEEIKARRFEHPVYIDHTGMFMELNGFLPQDATYHTFLTDGGGAISIIGNPLTNDRLLELLMDELEE